LLGLRPKRTAVVITVLTGSLISALSLGLLLLVSRQLRVGLFELNALEAKLRSSRADLKTSKRAQKQAGKELTTAQQRAAELRRTLKRSLEAERQRLSQDVDAKDVEIERTEQELSAVRSQIRSGEKELNQLEDTLLALRRGNVAISSGQPLATVTLKLERPDQAKTVIDQLLRDANLQAYQQVLPGQPAERQILLVPRPDIKRLEQTIRKPGTWVVNIRSAANVLLGETVVYAFPEVLPNVTVTREGEILARTTLASNERNPEAVRNRLNLLLASTLAEVQRRGSLSKGLQFDGNAINALGQALIDRNGGLAALEAVALRRSETADPIAIQLRLSQ
jgi:uncharacterized protein (DUF3084 family)